MPRGASLKREREYQELEQKFEQTGQYRGREKEVAARIVNKQRAQYGETKEEKQKDRQGRSPDRGLPIAEYQHMTIAQVDREIQGLSAADLRRIEDYEKAHRNRKGVMEAIGRRRHAA